ncbi:MAG: hypothetical protein AAF891_00020 [Pseudomonadota bacterium]
MPTALLVGAIGYGLWWVVDLRADNILLAADKVDLETKLALRDAQLLQAAKIRMIDGEYRALVEAERQEWEQLRRELQNMEGSDEPLDDYFGAVAERLWP